MARKFQVTAGGGLVLPTDCVDDEACMATSGKEIGVTKQRHLYHKGTGFNFLIGDTPTTKEVIIHRAATAGTVRNFRALLNVDGTTTNIDFDLKKNGTTILSAAVNLTHSTGDRVAVGGTISSATYAAGDVFSIAMTVTSATGASGPWAEGEWDEPAA